MRDGFVHLPGRKKNVLITGFGRNVSPEWVETALRGETAVAQAVVFGDGAAVLSRGALAVPPRDSDDAALQAAVGRGERHRCPTTRGSATGSARRADFDAGRAWPRPTAGRSAARSGTLHADALGYGRTLIPLNPEPS